MVHQYDAASTRWRVKWWWLFPRRFGEVAGRSDLVMKTICSKAGEMKQKIDVQCNLQEQINGLLSSWEDCGGHKPSAA
jgi:hypothetical protein